MSALWRHGSGEMSPRFPSFKEGGVERPLPVQVPPLWTVLGAQEVSEITGRAKKDVIGSLCEKLEGRDKKKLLTSADSPHRRPGPGSRPSLQK